MIKEYGEGGLSVLDKVGGGRFSRGLDGIAYTLEFGNRLFPIFGS